ncbi:MAG TPA: hypothetical protein DEP53_12585 [Bacteroidetes bacterium]|nr:hypothetical protein [Bacteroidota bacterium]
MGAGKFVSNNQRRKGGRMKLEWTTRVASATIVVGLLAVGLIGFLASSNDTSTQSPGGEAITWHSFDEGMALAAKENKKVLVDVYTDWCVWCKKMDKEVYTDGQIGRIIAKDFIAVKFNPEGQELVTMNNEHLNGSLFTQAMGISGYPSTLIFGADGKPITKIDGFQEAKEYAALLTFIGEDHYKTKSFQQFKSGLN